MMRIALPVLALLSMASVAGAAQAPLPPIAPAMVVLGTAKSVAGWTTFCERYAAECAVDASQPAKVALTPKVWGSVLKVNREVNRDIVKVIDQEHHGQPDVWTLAEDGKGDSEEHALVKRKRLAELGLPRRAMRITVVIDEKGEGHPVLTLVTDRGDLILDSKTNDIERWAYTGYVYIKRESQDIVGWVSLGGVTH